MEDRELSRVIAIALQGLEAEGELVITSASIEPLANRIADAVLTVVPNTSLSDLELLGGRRLILHAVSD
jgi:hypothetical protein